MPPRAAIEPIHAPKERAGFPWKMDVPATKSASRKRERTFFRTKGACEEACKEERARMAEFSDAAKHITGEQKLEYYKADQIARPLGFTVLQAVEKMAAEVAQSRRSMPVPQLIAALLAAKAKDGRRPHYIRDLRNRLRRFSDSFPATLASEITVEAVEQWLADLLIPNAKGKFHTAVSRNNYLRVLSVAFSFALDRGWMTSNPAEKISELPEPKEEVAIFTPDEIEGILQAAEPEIRPALAIGAFAGIRPEEILLLRWEHVRFDHGDILVLGRHAKTGSRRLVKITANLHTWLGEGGVASEKVVPKNFRKRRDAARIAAGVRHSFASYHLALHEDAAATALQLGHTTTKMLFDSYRGLVRKPDAVRYFNIVPRPVEP